MTYQVARGNARKIEKEKVFNVFDSFYELHMKSRKVGGILAKTSPKKGKTITTETLHLLTNVYEDGNFSRQVSEKKDYVSMSKGVHNQKLCNLQKSL